jgi:transposase
LKNTEIAGRLEVQHSTVRKWRNGFARDRGAGLLDEPRVSRPRSIADAKVEEVAVDAVDGYGGGAFAERGVEDLAGVRVAAASPGDVEALA